MYLLFSSSSLYSDGSTTQTEGRVRLALLLEACDTPEKNTFYNF